jgi:hypothetical protein
MTPPRPETGVMQFEQDWPGVFLRGDEALGLGVTIERVLTQAANAGIDCGAGGRLIKILRSCDASKNPKVQRARLVE